MKKEIAVTIVGPGALGTALVRALHEAGVEVEEIVHRSGAPRARKLAKAVGAKAAGFDRAGLESSLAWICVGDSAIAATAEAMVRGKSWKGAVVFHSSGALTSDELEPLRRAGAKVASVHPMMTFVRSSAPSMKGVPFGVEGDRGAMAVARKMVKQLGGDAFEIKKEDKALYHALGAFVSPLIVAQMAAAERIGRELGLTAKDTRKIVAPILKQTVANYVDHGPAAAFSGPMVRGDAETVRKNLIALKRVRGAAEIYRALARAAVEDLPSKDKAGIRKILQSE